MERKKIKNLAIKTISQTGEFLKKAYYKFDRSQVSLKARHEIITQYDLRAEKMIIKEIRQHFPKHRILSEEQGDNYQESDYFWIVDPIDGTTNFSIHNPLWSISIGVLYRGELSWGFVYAPILNELFVAEKNKGAYLNGKKIKVFENQSTKRINTFCHSREKKDILRALKYYQEQKLKTLDCRQLGSAAIELAYVACGRVDSLMIPGANSWDVAAGALLVQEAGGRVSDFSNKPWSLESNDILAASEKPHAEVLKTIKKLKLI